MNDKRRWLCVLALVLASCGPSSAEPPAALYPKKGAVCEQGEELVALSQEPKLSTIREAANVLLPFDGALWVVESFNNTVSKFEPETGEMKRGFVNLGNDRNPYDVAIDVSQGWVTNLLSNSVSVFDPKTGKILTEIKDPNLKSPSGVALTSTHAYVSNVNLAEASLGQGSVSVFERESFAHVGTVEVAAKNPQFLTSYQDAQGQWVLAVVSTGELGLNQEGAYVPRTPGALALWDLSKEPVPKEEARESWVIGISEEDPRFGGAGRALVRGEKLYMTSATAPVVYHFDLRARSWVLGPKNPGVLYETEDKTESTLHHGFLDARGLLWVTSFNDDALYVWDTACDTLLSGPMPLGVDPERLEGPHGVVVLPNQPSRIYYIMERSNVLGVLEPS